MWNGPAAKVVLEGDGILQFVIRSVHEIVSILSTGSSIRFCSKGVFTKLAHIHGADGLTVLTLRMGFAHRASDFSVSWHGCGGLRSAVMTDRTLVQMPDN
jgi:hypothetical protein